MYQVTLTQPELKCLLDALTMLEEQDFLTPERVKLIHGVAYKLRHAPEAEPEIEGEDEIGREDTYPDPQADINGTSLRGALEPIKYPDLVAKIGEPHNDGDGYKVDAEWIFQTPAGVATIYNYKSGPNYNPGGISSLNDVDDWHIGGKSEEVVEYIKQYVASR